MTTLDLTGLTCEHCVRAVKQALEEIPGVASVEVTLERACVGGTADPQALVRAIEAEGYTARLGA